MRRLGGCVYFNSEVYPCEMGTFQALKPGETIDREPKSGLYSCIEAKGFPLLYSYHPVLGKSGHLVPWFKLLSGRRLMHA
jgi:hypothetical protein